jgi:hypothetical protein
LNSKRQGKVNGTPAPRSESAGGLAAVVFGPRSKLCETPFLILKGVFERWVASTSGGRSGAVCIARETKYWFDWKKAFNKG